MENGELKVKKDWEIKKLGEVCQIKGGKRIPKGKKLLTEKTLHPYIRVTDFTDDGTVSLNDIHYISDEIYETIKQYTITTSDVFISIAGTIGKVGIIPSELNNANLTENACKLILNDKLYNKYLVYVFQSDKIKAITQDNARANAMPKLSITRLSNIAIPIPPLEEQKRIVKILDEKFAQLESLKANAQTNLQNAKDLFQSQLTKAFSNTTWEKKRLGDICSKIVDGTHNSPPNTKEGDYQYITAKNIKLSGIDLSDITYVTKEIHESIYSRCNPEKGDVLLIKDGATTGIAVVNELDYQFSMLSSVALLKFDRNILDSYCLAYLLNSDETYKRFRAKMEGAAITRLTLVKIKDFEIPLPPLPEQKRIVKELNTLSEKVRQLQEIYTKQIANCDELKQSLLQKAFEGEL